MIVQDDHVARRQIAGRLPHPVDPVPGAAAGGQHPVIGGQAQAMTLPRPHREHRFAARREETGRTGLDIPPVYPRHESAADQIAYLPRPVAGVHPGIGSDAGVGGVDGLAVGEVVACVDAVDEDHARFGGVVGRAHDPLPQVARRHLAMDGAGELERPRGALAHRVHERVAHQHRQVEHAQLARFALGVDEGLDVRVVARQRRHHGAAAVAGAHDRAAHGVPHPHERDRPRRIGADALHARALRAKGRKIDADAAALLHGQRRIPEAVEDSRHVVGEPAHHEAVEQRDAVVGAGAGKDSPGGQETVVVERRRERFLPARRLGLRRRQRPRHAAPAIVDGAVDRRPVGPLQAVF